MRPIHNMVIYEMLLKDLHLPADTLIGDEGKGFRYIVDGLNAERPLIAAGPATLRDGVERKVRETRLCQVAPVSLTYPAFVGEHVLEVPRSF